MTSPEYGARAPVLNKDFTIYILDENVDFCQALHNLMTADGFNSAFFVERTQFFINLERLRPHIVIMDARIGNRRTLDVLQRINKEQTFQVPVIITTQPAPLLNDEDFELGIEAVLAKPVTASHLLRTVKTILYRPDTLSQVGIQKRLRTMDGIHTLTRREREVLDLIVLGKTSKQAAERLGTSYKTVEVHRSHIYQKLGAVNSVDLMRIVLT
jgi:FixJ family two-component response regulator